MIRTLIVEAVAKDGKIEEVNLGWCEMPEVPVEKKAPQPPEPGKLPPQPPVIKINGQPFFVIGHTWDLKPTAADQDGPKADAQTTMVLIVQRVPQMPGGLVRADANTMGQLERMMPPPGPKN